MLKEKKFSKKIIAILIGIIVLILIVIVWRILIMGKKEKTSKNLQYEQKLQELETIGQKYTQLNEDLSMTNTSEKLNESKKIDELEIKDMKLYTKDNITTITATVINNGTTASKDFIAKINFIDDQKNSIIEIAAYINGIEPGQTTMLSATTTMDFVNAYDFIVTR